MAAQPLSTTRRALLGAAAALPIAALAGPPVIARTPDLIRGTKQSSPAAEIWTRRLARYHRLLSRRDSETERNVLDTAWRRHAQEVEAIQARFGSWDAAEATEEGRLLCDAAFERREVAQDAYDRRCVLPTDRAALLLALTPPPDLEALLVKIRVMDRHRLDEVSSMEPPALEVLADDVERLKQMAVACA